MINLIILGAEIPMVYKMLFCELEKKCPLWVGESQKGTYFIKLAQYQVRVHREISLLQGLLSREPPE